jgi:hypothetical protein
MANSPRCWVHCLDCGHRDMIRRSWLERRSRVRCSRCGGPVEPSPAARQDLIAGSDRRYDERRRGRA